jgi:hypothetical protein
MYLHSGAPVDLDSLFGAPVSDIAIHLCREPRFTGGTREIFTVGLHSMVVADLCRPGITHHALLHDSPEILIGDIPKGFKTPDMKKLERRILVWIYRGFSLELPFEDEWREVKAADERALHAEAYLIGPPGLSSWSPKDPAAEKVMEKYLGLPYSSYLDDDGPSVETFATRLFVAIKTAGGCVRC